MSNPNAPATDAALKAAQDKLDAHVREIIEWHFNPATGCPFWLERAKSLGFDPRKAVQTYDDLMFLKYLDDDWLVLGMLLMWF
ncbi:MAG: hypothetical protein ACK6D3_08490, partial [Planctomycetaceae bacterium]